MSRSIASGSPCSPISSASRQRGWICTQEQRNDHSLLSRCKTLAYGSIQARQEAQRRGAELALLRNTRGNLCCGDSANRGARRRVDHTTTQQWLPAWCDARATAATGACRKHAGR